MCSSSEFSKAYDEYVKISTFAKNEIDKHEPMNVDLAFYLSWAVHAVGNMCYSLEDYQEGNKLYTYALKLRENIFGQKDLLARRGVPIGFAYYLLNASKIKQIYTSTIDQVNTISAVIQNLLKVQSDIQNQKQIICEYDKRSYNILCGMLNYYLAKMSYYSGDYKESASFFDASIAIAEKTNDMPCVVRSNVTKEMFLSETEPSERLRVIDYELSRIRDDEINHPTLRALIGKQHLLEISVRMKSDAVTELYVELYNKRGILSHQPFMPNQQHGVLAVAH